MAEAVRAEAQKRATAMAAMAGAMKTATGILPQGASERLLRQTAAVEEHQTHVAGAPQGLPQERQATRSAKRRLLQTREWAQVPERTVQKQMGMRERATPQGGLGGPVQQAQEEEGPP